MMGIGRVFTVSDTHFNHYNIIKYEATLRPFSSIKEMNEFYISQWNSVVRPYDLVIHCGDFGFGSVEELTQIFNQLNGNKFLIKGNHDGAAKMRKIGFSHVVPYLKCGKILFTHKPQPSLEEGVFNVHGHIHGKVLPDFSPDKYLNVSVEKTNGKPILITKEMFSK